ncbi:MAG: hypothetical protein HGA62_06085 [Chlorobiaceae bacterium]|nr:hypothetical protein [Chlorobiaceae bacterium]NTV60383.1 hypothetical protein [Chlorobiaceae bacterium]
MARPSLWQDMKKTLLFHAIAAHFSNGLIPVAVLYLMLAIPTGNSYFEHTVAHLMVITLIAIPASFFTGVHDWKTKYKGARAPIFMKKLKLSGILFTLCILAVTIRLSTPDVMSADGALHWLYLLLVFSMLPVVTLLGHYGGKLSAQSRQGGKS